MSRRLRKLVRPFLCESTLYSPCQMPGRVKGGNGSWHVRWVLPVVGSKAIVDHTRLVNLHADGEGESGAYYENFSKEKRLTPPPSLERGKTRNCNRHNTLSPFSSHALCSLLGEINRCANGVPPLRRKIRWRACHDPFDAPPQNRGVPMTLLLQAYGEGAMCW